VGQQVFDFCNTHQFQVLEKKNQRFFKYHRFQVFEKNSESKELLGLGKKKTTNQIQRTASSGYFAKLQKSVRFHERTDKGFLSCISQLHTVLS
jgi:hypothetical protein